MQRQAIRERLKIYAKRNVTPVLVVKYMKELVNILEEHPDLGTAWSEKAWRVIHDIEDAFVDLEDT